MKNIKINSTRTLVRAFQIGDLDKFMEYRNNEEWMTYQNFKGLTRGEYEVALLKEVNLEKGIQLAIIEKENNNLIGDIFLLKEENDFWMGYTITPTFAKQGYTYEVASSVIDWIKENYSNHNIMAGAHPENIASINLLKKLGFEKVGIEDGDDIFKLI